MNLENRITLPISIFTVRNLAKSVRGNGARATKRKRSQRETTRGAGT